MREVYWLPPKGYVQGIGIAVFGVFFLIFGSILYMQNRFGLDRMIIFAALSAVLIALGVVIVALSRRVPKHTVKKKQRQKI